MAMANLFTKENLPMTVVIALIVLAWLSFLSVVLA
jgi:hypothetical protein